MLDTLRRDSATLRALEGVARNIAADMNANPNQIARLLLRQQREFDPLLPALARLEEQARLPLVPLRFNQRELSILRGIPGGPSTINQLIWAVNNNRPTQEIAGREAPLATALRLREGGTQVLGIDVRVRKSGETKDYTDIDVLTSAEMVEIKTGNYLEKSELAGEEREQFTKLRNIFLGNLKVVLITGEVLQRPPRWVYEFTGPVHPDLIVWLESRDVSEVRIRS